ncbi:hypothetical protein BCCH1_04120 [Burkholderia contaminans]|uniref:Uncharacterized protein n=1 Tax=Burkholderia contaminans TaxID=488447 RepID=A0A286P5C9_9BURK|nr:hypothetical protein BCCH1_04120 [Burkholderia contaminans]GLZ72863.1 hypothetical protein Bcon01_59080 [Burkholderia contaminans]
MYASIAPPGPACEIDAPDATNRPVPIEPPIAIIRRWRACSARWRDGFAGGEPEGRGESGRAFECMAGAGRCLRDCFSVTKRDALPAAGRAAVMRC